MLNVVILLNCKMEGYHTWIKPLCHMTAMMVINFNRELDIVHLELALPVEIGRKKTYCAVSCHTMKNSAIYRRYHWQKKDNQIIVNFV